MKPWKRRPPVWDSAADKGLQWGHGDEAVEECALLKLPSKE